MRRISDIPADHRVQLAGPGHFRQVPAVFFQGLVFFLRGLVRDPLRAPELRQGLEDGVQGQPLAGQQTAHVAFAVRSQGQEDMLRGDVLVLHPVRLLEGFVQGLI